MANGTKKENAQDIFDRLSGTALFDRPKTKDAAEEAKQETPTVNQKPAEAKKPEPAVKPKKKEPSVPDNRVLRSYYISQDLLDAMALKRSLDHGKKKYSDYVAEALEQYLGPELNMVRNR